MEHVARLKSRGILGLEGPNVHDFLQGVITNDIQKLAPNALLYAAHLTPQGRFLYDFFIAEINGDILIDCDRDELMDVAKSLHEYDIAKKIDFHDLSDEYSVFSQWNSQGTEVGRWLADPRHPKLGRRSYLRGKDATPQPDTSEDEYNAYTLSLAIPDGTVDVVKGKTLANEMRLEDLNGVSFTKGCYVGQELTARTKYRTNPKKGYFIVHFDSDDDLPPGTEILRGKTTAGHLFRNTGGVGLAMLRFRDVDKGEPLLVNGKELKDIRKPDWVQADYY